MERRRKEGRKDMKTYKFQAKKFWDHTVKEKEYL
jgi:hypothetical protein